MQLYGNEIWNNATPNSEKAVMVTEKEHLEVALKALDETGVNYCYYVKDNEVTIAFAKIAVQKSELENLRKIPELSALAIVQAKGNYTPKTSVIGNTAYKDIQNRYYQKLETDLALKVANELHQNGIRFSGRIYDHSTTITIDSADKQEFERIVQDIVSVRNSYQRKLEGISLINEDISALNEGSQIILKPLVDMCYTRGEEFSNQLFTLIDEADDFTEQQLKLYSAEFIRIYEPLKESEYLFADRTSLDHLKEQFAKDNLFEDVIYLRGYSTEQKAAMRQLIEDNIPRELYNLIDYNFSPSDIRSIGKIWQENLTNTPERIYQHIANVKGYSLSALQNYLRLGTYLPDTAKLDRIKYITDYYSTRENADGNIIYRVPIETNVGILNRLAENGVIEEGLQNAHLILESDGRDYNVILTLDNNDVQLGSVDISVFLTDSEQRVILDVVNEVIRLEKEKQLAHETDTDLNSKPSEEINGNLEQIVASIGEKGKAFTEMVKAEEFSKAREILKELNVLALQAERQKAVIQQEAITTEDVDKLREIEPKRKSVQNMLETEVAQTPKFEKLLGEELGEKSPYEMRKGNLDWRKDEASVVPIVEVMSRDDINIKRDKKNGTLPRGNYLNQDTGITINIGSVGIEDTLTHASFDAKRHLSIEARLSALYHIDELIKHAICFDTNISQPGKNKSPNTLFMHKLYGVFHYENSFYLADLTVEELYSTDIKEQFSGTTNRFYNLKDIKITPLELEMGFQSHGVPSNDGRAELTNGVIYSLTIPQLYEIVKEYDHSFYENEQSPGRTERLEEIQAQEDFKNSVEILQSHISKQEETQAVQPEVETATPEQVEEMNASIPDDMEIPDINAPSIPIAQEETVYSESAVVAEFRNKTMESFHLIGDRTELDIELEVADLLQQEMTDNDIAGEIVSTVLYGSRSRGLETSEDTDIDIVVQIDGAELKEDALFNLFSDMDIEIDGIPVDVNPIRPEETGTLEDYLPKAEAYLEQKQESIQPKEEKSGSVPEESPQLSFDISSTIPTKNEPDGTVTLDLNEYDDPDYYEQQQIAEQEAAEASKAPKAENFRITDSEIGSGTPLQRFNNNLAAIRLLKELEADGRQTAPEEQETLSRYVGWGGLAEFLKESNPHYQELRDLLTEDEYSSARATTLDSFYTSPVIIDSIYTVLQNAGFEGGNILEPSMGIGNFFGRMPQEIQVQSKLFGVEIDNLTGRIANPFIHSPPLLSETTCRTADTNRKSLPR